MRSQLAWSTCSSNRQPWSTCSNPMPWSTCSNQCMPIDDPATFLSRRSNSETIAKHPNHFMLEWPPPMKYTSSNNSWIPVEVDRQYDFWSSGSETRQRGHKSLNKHICEREKSRESSSKRTCHCRPRSLILPRQCPRLEYTQTQWPTNQDSEGVWTASVRLQPCLLLCRAHTTSKRLFLLQCNTLWLRNRMSPLPSLIHSSDSRMSLPFDPFLALRLLLHCTKQPSPSRSLRRR